MAIFGKLIIIIVGLCEIPQVQIFKKELKKCNYKYFKKFQIKKIKKNFYMKLKKSIKNIKRNFQSSK